MKPRPQEDKRLVTRRRKTRRLRGSRTHGWGTSGQHRKGGMIGGHGKAGEFKHKWTAVLRYGGKRYGKYGFKSLSEDDLSTINVGQLDELSEKLDTSKEMEEQKGPLELDLTKMGFRKLLGEGKVRKAYSVKVPHSSELAIKKIEAAGGQVKGLQKTE